MIIDGICRFASTKRWHVENITSRDKTMEIGRLLDFWKPIGCIAEISPVSTLPIKAFRGVPVVFLNRSPLETDGKASVVEMDHAACVKLAVEELLRGKPAMLGYTPYLIPSRTWNIQGRMRLRRCCRIAAFRSRSSPREARLSGFRA